MVRLKCKNELLKFIMVGFHSGNLYVAIEVFHHRSSHWSMWLLAFLVVGSVDLIDELFPKIPTFLYVCIGTVFATIGEGVFGNVFNRDYSIYDYRKLWGSFWNDQCNIFFVGIWFILILIGINYANLIRHFVFKEKLEWKWF